MTDPEVYLVSPYAYRRSRQQWEHNPNFENYLLNFVEAPNAEFFKIEVLPQIKGFAGA